MQSLCRGSEKAAGKDSGVGRASGCCAASVPCSRLLVRSGGRRYRRHDAVSLAGPRESASCLIARAQGLRHKYANHIHGILN